MKLLVAAESGWPCGISLFLSMVWSWEVNVSSHDGLLIGGAVAATATAYNL